MSEIYKGGKIPADLPPQLKKLVEDHDRVLTRGVTPGNFTINNITNTTVTPNPPGSVGIEVSNLSGTVYRIPLQAPNRMTIFRFPLKPTLKDSGVLGNGNLQLNGDFKVEDGFETITLISDGRRWIEVARGRAGAIGAVFVPAALWGAIPGTGTDMTNAIQKAIDNAPAGCYLTFAPGIYLMDTVTVTRSNLTVFAAPGAHFKQNGTDTLFKVLGTVGSSYTLPSDTTAGEIYLTVTAGDEANFSADDYCYISDDRAATGGATAICGELNKVKSTSSGQLKLYYPMQDAYTTANTATVETITVIENVHFVGGKFESAASADVGSSGITFLYTWGCSVKNAEFVNCRIACVAIETSQSFGLYDNYMHDPPRFEEAGGTGFSGGYGFTAESAIGTVVSGNHIHRTRHAIDFTFFSRNSVAVGNHCHTTAVNGIKIHPDNEDVIIANNTFDGAAGANDGALGDNDGTDLDTTTGVGNVLATGINVDNNCSRILILGNTVRNTTTSGINVLPNGSNYIYILNNSFYNCNWKNVSSPRHAAILVADQASSGTTFVGYVIQGNRIQTCNQVGIYAGIDDILVADNTVEDINGSLAIGIWAAANGTADVNRPIIKNNIVRDCLTNAIRVGGGGGSGDINDAVVEGNYIENITLSGIWIATNRTNGCSIRNNTVQNCNNANPSDSSHAAITVTEQGGGGVSFDDYVVEGNFIRGVCRYGIIANISNMLIKDNICQAITSNDGSPTGIGIYIASPASATPSGITITGNHCEDCADDGIRVAGTAGGVITATRLTNNVCKDNTVYGIRIQSQSTSAVLVDNIAVGNGTGNILDDSSTTLRTIAHPDLANYRYGIGTTTPAARLDVLLAGEQLRLSNTSSFYTSIQTVADGFYGGLAIEPLTNSSSLKFVHFFAQNWNSGVSILDDGSTYFFRSEDSGQDVSVACDSTRSTYLEAGAGSRQFRVQATRCATSVPMEFITSDASTSTVLRPIVVKASSTGGDAAAGFGAGIDWQLEYTGNNYTTAAYWDTVWKSVNVDAYSSITVMDNNSLVEVLRVSGNGGSPGVRIEDGVAGAPAALLDVRGAAIFNEDGNDHDFRVESANVTDMLFVDGGNDEVHIGTSIAAGGSGYSLNVLDSAYVLGTTSAVIRNEETSSNAWVGLRSTAATTSSRVEWGSGGSTTAQIQYAGGDLKLSTQVTGSGRLMIAESANWTTDTTGGGTLAFLGGAPAAMSSPNQWGWLIVKDNAGTVTYIPAWQ